MVDVPLPAVIGDVAVTVDCAGDTGPGLTTTLAVCVRRSVPFTLAVTVLVPAAVELSVPVAWPFTSVVAAGCVSGLPGGGAARERHRRPAHRIAAGIPHRHGQH